MTPDFFTAYSYSHAGKHDRKPYAVARFVSPDGTRLNRRVPGPGHVTRNLTVPTLSGLDPATVQARLRELLATMPLRTNNGRGGDVSDHYLGLYAALHWSGPADFDRDAYLSAIADSTLIELRRETDRDARVTPPADRPIAHTGTSTTLTAAEVKARFHAAREARERDYARASILELLDLNEVEDGDVLTRAELVDAVLGDLERAQQVLTRLREDNDAAQRAHAEALHQYGDSLAVWEERKRMQPGLSPRTKPKRPARPAPTLWETRATEHGLPASPPPSFGARRAASLVIELAPELGLIESRSGNVRRYVYTPPTHRDAHEELRMNPDATLAQVAAYDTLAASMDRAAEAAARFAHQRDLLAAGDRLGALHSHAERHLLRGAPNNVVPLRRSTRAA